jgi:N-methylhydantoinase A/oxoprolinase/acetone carboxylase beta subunit
MSGLRIGIDVGGTFTHGVVLRPPGEVIASARRPTTHRAEQGVAAGVQQVVSELLTRIDAAEVELVAHSTTQATNALLEGDVAPVVRIAIVPPGEGGLVRMALRGERLDLGGDHQLPVATEYVAWEQAESYEPPAAPDGEARRPRAVIQPLAGRQELREEAVAEACRRAGLPVVCAAEITQVLGLTARARTAAVNASMLPAMLRTADFTERAVDELLSGVPLQVVRSDGGAMSIDEMRRQPILSLLSGPAAGASAALDRAGLSEVVFIEVGGTSTDITLIKEGRVRHRYATVGGQRLMVPALDLRTVAVGGGSMLRTDLSRFGPRSAHIAGLPYLFQLLSQRRGFKQLQSWDEAGHADGGRESYWIAETSDGSMAALTLTDLWLSERSMDECRELAGWLGLDIGEKALTELRRAVEYMGRTRLERARARTLKLITQAVHELARAHRAELAHFTLIGGGGGAPVASDLVAGELGIPGRLAMDHTVISAIGAALAVTCASQSVTVAEPGSQDIALLTRQVEERLRTQGAARVSTDYEYDPHRQVLTVTGRGSRAYQSQARALAGDELQALAAGLLGAGAELAWQGDGEQLWAARAGGRACALDRFGRALWTGKLREWFDAPGSNRETVLGGIIDRRTQYTDGGPALPGLALIAAGRFIPLDQLGSRSLIDEVLRWENLPAAAPGCFVIRD